MSSTNKRLAAVAPNSAPASKKPRKKPTTAKSLGLTKNEYDRIKSAPIKRDLKAIVKTLANQVDADWHDGYEEQSETKVEWFEAMQEPLQAVLDIGVGKKTALVQCNEILKIVSDSFYDLLSCPCRCDTLEEFSEMSMEFDLNMPWGSTLNVECRSPQDAWSYVWVALLRTHAALPGADKELILRCIKDASDNMKGAELMKLPGCLYDKMDDDFDEDDLKDGEGVPNGDALARLVEASEWKSLPTTKKVHRTKRAIDRRFYGSPSRRTRDYDSDEQGDCVIS